MSIMTGPKRSVSMYSPTMWKSSGESFLPASSAIVEVLRSRSMWNSRSAAPPALPLRISLMRLVARPKLGTDVWKL